MQLLSCHQGRIFTTDFAANNGSTKSFTTGLCALDELLPRANFARGAVHELLALPSHPLPLFFALLLARSAMNQPKNSSGSIVWCDPQRKLYPPAVATLGMPLDRLFLLRPKTIADENWAIAECLRCRGVSATIASPRRLSRIEARRFQLAAERGGGIGILLRPFDRNAHVYAAATRWLVAPARGERTIQRWKIQLIHGHGGRIGQSVILEHHREHNSIQVHTLRAIEQLADRSVPKTA